MDFVQIESMGIAVRPTKAHLVKVCLTETAIKVHAFSANTQKMGLSQCLQLPTALLIQITKISGAFERAAVILISVVTSDKKNCGIAF